MERTVVQQSIRFCDKDGTILDILVTKYLATAAQPLNLHRMTPIGSGLFSKPTTIQSRTTFCPNNKEWTVNYAKLSLQNKPDMKTAQTHHQQCFVAQTIDVKTFFHFTTFLF